MKYAIVSVLGLLFALVATALCFVSSPDYDRVFLGAGIAGLISASLVFISWRYGGSLGLISWLTIVGVVYAFTDIFCRKIFGATLTWVLGLR